MLARLYDLLKDFIDNDLRPILREIREFIREAIEYIREKRREKQQQPPDRLFDMKHAEKRIGVGEKTISRLTKKGELPVARVFNRKRYFRESDIERCRRLYGRE